MTAALAKAREFLALGVKEFGRVPNDGPPALLFMRGDRLPWCAGFVLTCLDLAGVKNLRYWTSRNVQAFEDLSKARSHWFEPSQHPCPGDVVFFASRGASDAGTGRHCGFVSSVAGSEVFTIEGNVGDKIAEMRYSLTDSRITGYARWAP